MCDAGNKCRLSGSFEDPCLPNYNLCKPLSCSKNRKISTDALNIRQILSLSPKKSGEELIKLRNDGTLFILANADELPLFIEVSEIIVNEGAPVIPSLEEDCYTPLNNSDYDPINGGRPEAQIKHYTALMILCIAIGYHSDILIKYEIESMFQAKSRLPNHIISMLKHRIDMIQTYICLFSSKVRRSSNENEITKEWFLLWEIAYNNLFETQGRIVMYGDLLEKLELAGQ